MAMSDAYEATEPTREEIESLRGSTLLEFGSPYCGHCHAVQPKLAGAFSEHQDIRHIKIADGSGQPLGRSFQVKLWPTLIFISDGKEVKRLVRPQNPRDIHDAFTLLSSADN